MSLPPLSEPINGVDGPDGPWPLFTTEQMQAYAKLAVREALERVTPTAEDKEEARGIIELFEKYGRSEQRAAILLRRYVLQEGQ